MQMEDMILVSVDDHVCEPPEMWDNHVPTKWKDRAPKLVTKDDGSNLWVFEGAQIPNVGLNAVAGRPPEEYGMEPTALSQLRPGCYDVDARVEDMNANGVLGSLCFPTVPGFVGELFGRQAAAGEGELAITMLRAFSRIAAAVARLGGDDATFINAYVSFYPSANLSYTVDDRNQWVLSYNRRVNRPRGRLTRRL